MREARSVTFEATGRHSTYYQRENYINKGAFGSVRHGHKTKTNDIVAIKQIKPSKMTKEEQMQKALAVQWESKVLHKIREGQDASDTTRFDQHFHRNVC
jgi:serine/threonine protein kinase